jgi:3-phenylpropionate/trans-cinnamate dioxygenase ferredoxin component
MSAPCSLGPSDLAEGETRSLEVGDRLVLVSRLGGAYFAISDWCNHAGCQLSRGVVEGTSVTCPCHGATFDLRSGRNLNAPELCGDQDAWPVRVSGGQLWAWFG